MFLFLHIQQLPSVHLLYVSQGCHQGQLGTDSAAEASTGKEFGAGGSQSPVHRLTGSESRPGELDHFNGQSVVALNLLWLLL